MIDTRPATNATRSAMFTVDCPLCDAPAPYDADADTLDCPACSIHLALAADVPAPNLAAAA